MWFSIWIGGDTQKRSFLVLKKGGRLVSANQPVSQEEATKYGVSGEMMRLEPSAGRTRQNRTIAGREDDDTAGRCEREVRVSSDAGPGLE